MKTIIPSFIALALAMTVSLTSCEKTPTPDPTPEPDPVSYSLIFADASVRPTWKAGDKINIWADSNTGETPDAVVVYNGSAWKLSENAAFNGSTFKENGTVKALYEGGNNLKQWYYYDAGFSSTLNMEGGIAYYSPLLISATGNYSATEGNIFINVKEWIYLNDYKVIITGLQPLKIYQMAVSTDSQNYLRTVLGFYLEKDAIDFNGANPSAFVYSTSDDAGNATFCYQKSYKAEYKDIYRMFTLYKDSTKYVFGSTTNLTPQGSYQEAKFSFSSFK